MNVRIALPVLFTIVILTITALIGYTVFEWEIAAAENPSLELYPAGEPLDAHLLQLDRQALDEAYLAQAKKLWGVRVSQPNINTGPFKTGMHNARRAYHEADAQIRAREQQLQR